MASGKDRARKLARAKVERQIARRASEERRRRRIQAGVGASLALLLIFFGAFYLLGGFDKDEPPAEAESPCLWTPKTDEPDRDDVGTPPTTDIPTEGSRPMTITINSKPVVVDIDLALAPCAAASFAHLAGQGYFDNSTCTELNETEGWLRCGDKKGNGLGGPTYSFANEYVPDPQPTPSAGASPDPAAEPVYAKGTVAMIGSPPGSNGSQFLIFYKDSSPAAPDYSIVGHVTGDGLGVIEAVAMAGTVENSNGQKTKPKNDVVIQSLTVGDVNATGAVPTPAATTTAAGTTPSGAASPSPSAAS